MKNFPSNFKNNEELFF